MLVCTKAHVWTWGSVDNLGLRLLLIFQVIWGRVSLVTCHALSTSSQLVWDILLSVPRVSHRTAGTMDKQPCKENSENMSPEWIFVVVVVVLVLSELTHLFYHTGVKLTNINTYPFWQTDFTHPRLALNLLRSQGWAWIADSPARTFQMLRRLAPPWLVYVMLVIEPRALSILGKYFTSPAS